MLKYWNDNWQQLFIANNLANFDALWNLKAKWFEEPNIQRGGWSGVIKYVLNDADKTVDVFIKRQENHISRTFRHPFTGIATFQKEFHNIQRLTDKKIPTLELIYFAQQNQQAILITKSLEDYCSLDSEKLYDLTHQQKRALLSKIATVSATMHQWRFQHNCFYPKHIFVQHLDDGWDVKFIDLEKLKRPPFKKQAVVRDLLTLYRHADTHWTIKDRIYFFKVYVNENKLSDKSKRLWYTIAKKIQAKAK